MPTTTKITIRDVPTEVVRAIRRIAAERTFREDGRRTVPVNELYLEALKQYVDIEEIADSINRPGGEDA